MGDGDPGMFDGQLKVNGFSPARARDDGGKELLAIISKTTETHLSEFSGIHFRCGSGNFSNNS